MEMVDERLRPSMQNADKSEPAFKSPLRIFGKGLKGLIDSGKQDVHGHLFVGKYKMNCHIASYIPHPEAFAHNFFKIPDIIY
jgi:hypothetical protein